MAIKVIRLYQITLSPIFGRSCRFTPTCSEYARQAFQYYSFFQATFLTVKRILKCHPFHAGGVDELPMPTKHNKVT